ncbi:hypothetical protein MKW94_012229 [Papaver nudicaule]|uniref:Uncharacterized protein n=1 Tax=Papaver nudicaule TaxID=74823 RepID=A0AA41V6P8_PAPNU|nr:hypothetical protein [Papaver nudicaule]
MKTKQLVLLLFIYHNQEKQASNSLSVMTTTSNPACCDDYYIGHCDLYLIHDKRRCSDFCVPGGCRGGECRYRDGLNACHCYCN